MKLLSISTASDVLSLSIVENKKSIASFSSEGNKRHAELITPKIKELLQSLNLKPSDLDGLCVNLGPGSFTGLRVGLSTAKGLVFGAGIKLFCYTNFEELLYQAILERKIFGRVAVLIPSRKNEFYFGAFDINQNNYTQLDAFELMKLNELKNFSHHFDMIIADKKIKDLLLSELKNVEIIGIENNSFYGALIVQSDPQKYLCENYFYLEPLYLKNFDVKVKK